MKNNKQLTTITNNFRQKYKFLFSLMAAVLLYFKPNKLVALGLLVSIVGIIFLFIYKENTNSISIKPEKFDVIILSMALGTFGVHSFYETWLPSQKIGKIAEILHLPKNVFLLIISLLLCSLGFYAFYLLSRRIISILPQIFGEAKKFILKQKNIFFSIGILIFIYLIGISAILRANFNYIDDMGRVDMGYKGWENFSRLSSNFLSTFVHAGNYLTDVSPLTQVIAVIILAVSGIIVLYVVSEKTRFSVWQFIAILPMGLSPYFLECISYKYDSPYMALSILASVFPILFYKKSNISYVISAIIGIIIVCTTYQAATGIFPMLVILIALKQWNRKENINSIGKFIVLSVAGYGIGLVIFRLFIMQPVEAYVSNMIPPIMQLFPKVFKHIIKYFILIKNDFKKEWIVLIIILCMAFIFAMVRDSKQKKQIAFLVSTFTLGIMILLVFGIYPVLEEPLYRPRAMYGFGVFIAFIMVSVATVEKMYFSKIVCICLSWMFFVFSFTYGNALFVQKTYTDFRIEETINSLQELEVLKADQEKTVQIVGSIGQAPALRNMPQDYQMLNHLVPVAFGNSEEYWLRYGFSEYYGLKNIIWNTSIDLTTYNLPVLQDSTYHTIKGKDDYILIELKD